MNQNRSEDYDVVIRNGTIYDGSGSPPFVGDIAIHGDAIGLVGSAGTARGEVEVDASGLAVAPGFINMLSHAMASLIVDGRSQSDIRQGVTLEVFGEVSLGPLNAALREEFLQRWGDIKFDIPWTTLAEYLDHLVARGISTNVASFVSATTVRTYVLGHQDRQPSEVELDQMRDLVREAMKGGALGVASALIYAPATYAETDELIALARVAGEYGGSYISHIRSEGDRLIEAVDELITISRVAGVRAEIYHLKQAGLENWGKLEAAIGKIEDARANGLRITADMYPYAAAQTGLDSVMPPWVQEGGQQPWMARLADPDVRARVRREMSAPGAGWENWFWAAGSAENIRPVVFKNPALKPLAGKSLAEIAATRGKSPEETAMDLVIEDSSRVGTLFFAMSEENVRRQITLPWMSFGSDAQSVASEGVFLLSRPHPRTYGTFARLLGRYVRDENLIPLEEAIRRLTSLPADNLRIRRRGRLVQDYFADVVVFDPSEVRDRATYQEPHRYASGVVHVFVNGVQVVREAEHTGALPGRVVTGPALAEQRPVRTRWQAHQ